MVAVNKVYIISKKWCVITMSLYLAAFTETLPLNKHA